MAIVSQPTPAVKLARIRHRTALPAAGFLRCSAAAPPKRPVHVPQHENLAVSAAVPPKRPVHVPQHENLAASAAARAPLLNDPTLKSTWSQRAWLAAGCTTVMVSLAKSVVAAESSNIWLEPLVSGLIGYVLADLASGVYHWGIDNYGSSVTPVFGPQIEAFQGHHKWPWTITRRQFANNLYSLAKAVAFTVLPVNVLCDDPTVLGFVAACSGCIMFSQQFHSWAHTTKSKLPPVVVALQDAGVLVSRQQHAAHHWAPYNNNYCIVSGMWNEILDESRFFEALEMVIFFRFGVRPRSWAEPSSDWTEDLAA